MWGIFALAYGSLGMRESAATWGAGACIFLFFAVAMWFAHRRAMGDAPAAELREAQHLDIVLVAAVAVVWAIFAVAYGALGLPISATTWGVGAWLFLGLTVGLVVASRRDKNR